MMVAFQARYELQARTSGGIWQKNTEKYKDYGGESINLTKYRETFNSVKDKEKAAFETITGKWAKDNGFIDVIVLEAEDLNNEVIVLFKN